MKKDSFAKKLAGYVAMGSAFLAAQKECDAQIVYTNVNPDSLIQNGFFNLDLNNDGITDFILTEAASGSYATYNGYTVFDWSNKSYKIHCLLNNGVNSDTLQFPNALNSGNIIGTNNNFGNGQILFHRFYSYPLTFVSEGNWISGDEKFLGLKFKIGSLNYYGWARLDVHYGYGLIVKDYAYYNVPDHPILAGETDCENYLTDIVATPDISACEGDEISLQVNQMTTDSIKWYWNNSEIFSGDSIIQISESGNYYAVLSFLTCLDTTNSLQIIFNPLPQIPIIIQQDSVLITTQLSGVHYEWYHGIYPIPNSDSYFIIPTGLGDYRVTVTDENGCSVSSNWFVVYPVSANSISGVTENLIFTVEQKQLNLIQLPNELLNAEIKIFDASGRILLQQKINSSTEQISLSNFSSGIYFFEIRKEEIVVRKKFFVE